MSSIDLILKPACEGCGSPSDLYGSNCKHKTLCSSCGKRMAENRNRCNVCGTPVTKLIREYNVRSSASTDKSCFIGRFVTGLPPFSKKKNTDNKWTLHKDGLQGRQLTDALRDKYKNKPWVLEDETGQHQFQGQLEGAQSATYYLLVLQGKEFTAVPASSWYNFNKVAQYKQLTTEEAEEIMSKRKSSASGYERWMMKAANSGPAAFGEVKEEEKVAIGRGSKKLKSKDDGGKSDNDEEDGDMEVKRKFGSGLNRKGVDEDDEDEKGGDKDFDDDIEIGDDWEHEEIFTDDDEAVENDPLEREDLLAPEIPAPPEIKQDDEDEDEVEDEEGGLSTSGKELKKLLGKAAGLDESDVEEEDDDDDVEDENATSPVLAPKQKLGVKDESLDNSPSKAIPAGSARGTPSNSKSKSKKKSTTEDAKISNSAIIKKEPKLSVKEEPSSVPRSSSSTVPKTGSTAAEGPVTEEEIRTILLDMAPVTTQELVGKFKGRIKTQEDKKAFADILRKIGKIQKMNGQGYVVLREMK